MDYFLFLYSHLIKNKKKKEGKIKLFFFFNYFVLLLEQRLESVDKLIKKNERPNMYVEKGYETP